MDIERVLEGTDPQEAYFALLKCVLDEPYKIYKDRVPQFVRLIAESGQPEWALDTLQAAGRIAGRDPETLQLGAQFLTDEDKQLLLSAVLRGGGRWIHETLRLVFLTSEQKGLLLSSLVECARADKRERRWVRETLKWVYLEKDDKMILKQALR
jgi:hypothetical protein